MIEKQIKKMYVLTRRRAEICCRMDVLRHRRHTMLNPACTNLPPTPEAEASQADQQDGHKSTNEPTNDSTSILVRFRSTTVVIIIEDKKTSKGIIALARGINSVNEDVVSSLVQIHRREKDLTWQWLGLLKTR